MKKSLCAAALCLSLCFIAGVASARAESVSYPEKNPAFTFDLPQDWKAVFDNGALKLAPKQGDALVLFQHVSDVKDDATAKEALPVLARKAGETFSMKDGHVAVKETETTAGKFKTLMTAYKGKDKDNEDAFWYVAIFAPTKGDYYLMTVVYSLKDEKQTANDRALIQTSIRPAGTTATAPASKAEIKKDAAEDEDAEPGKSNSGGLGAKATPQP